MAIIYDIETLSQDQYRGVIVSMALLEFDLNRLKYGKPYTWEGLLEDVQLVKFDVESQVKKHGRHIAPDTLNWWKDQPPSAQKQLAPRKDDVSLSELYSWFISNVTGPVDVAYTRSNTFDPVFIQFACEQFGDTMPHPWWVTRDTRSTIDGMAWGEDINNKFIPEGLEEKFIAHDPAHDIVMDVMRIQYLSRILVDEIPF